MMLIPGTDLNEFAAAAAMRAAALHFISGRLAAAIARRGRALMLVSGGSTPLPLYSALSDSDLDWSKVTIALVDERWVDADHEASNERAIRAALLRERARNTGFVGMKSPDISPQEAVPALDKTLRSLPWPADVAILGMGPDGHTASWFPNAKGLAAAIDPETPALCAAVSAHQSAVTGAYTERMTLTLPPVLTAGATLLLMTGEDKRRTYKRALASGSVEDLPVRALFSGDRAKLFCCWAP